MLIPGSLCASRQLDREANMMPGLAAIFSNFSAVALACHFFRVRTLCRTRPRSVSARADRLKPVESAGRSHKANVNQDE